MVGQGMDEEKPGTSDETMHFNHFKNALSRIRFENVIDFHLSRMVVQRAYLKNFQSFGNLLDIFYSPIYGLFWRRKCNHDSNISALRRESRDRGAW